MDALRKLSPKGFGSENSTFTFFSELATFARSLVTGSAATLADLAVLAFFVGVLSASAKAANVPALFAGAAVQFFGNRHFVFRASSGPLRRQALLFLGSEAVAMALNAALYHGVATYIPLTKVGAVVARMITTHLVFVLFSYPVSRRIFHLPGPPTAAHGG